MQPSAKGENNITQTAVVAAATVCGRAGQRAVRLTAGAANAPSQIGNGDNFSPFFGLFDQAWLSSNLGGCEGVCGGVGGGGGDQNVSTLQKFTAECSLVTLDGRVTMTVCSKV